MGIFDNLNATSDADLLQKQAQMAQLQELLRHLGQIPATEAAQTALVGASNPDGSPASFPSFQMQNIKTGTAQPPLLDSGDTSVSVSPGPVMGGQPMMQPDVRRDLSVQAAGGAPALYQMQAAQRAAINAPRLMNAAQSLEVGGNIVATAPQMAPDAARSIDYYRAQIAKLGPGTPEAAPYEAALEKANYIPEKDPLKIAETKASIAEKNAQAGMATTRSGLMTDSGIAPETVQLRAQMWAAGDMDGAFKGIPSSIYGSPARKAIADMGAQLAGPSGADQVARGAALAGDKAGMRTAATAGAKMDTLSTEVQKFADLATSASDALPRGNFVPLTTAEQAIQSGTSSPELAAFVAANTSLVNAYSAVAGRGTPTVAGQEHAYKMLSTATGPEAYKAVVKQLLAETAAAKASPNATMEDIRKRITSPGGGVTMPAQPNASAGGPSPVAPVKIPRWNPQSMKFE